MEDWAKVGQVSKIETAVYQGYGSLVTSLGKVWNEEARNFVKKVPEKIVSIILFTFVIYLMIIAINFIVLLSRNKLKKFMTSWKNPTQNHFQRLR